MRTQERRYAWINAFMEVLVAGVLVGPAVITMKLPPVLSFQLHLNQIQVNTPARNTLRTSIFQSSGNNHEQGALGTSPGSMEELATSDTAANCTCKSPNMTATRTLLPPHKMDGMGDVAEGSKQQIASEDALPQTKSGSSQLSRRIFMASALIGSSAFNRNWPVRKAWMP